MQSDKTDTSDGLCSVDEMIGGGNAYYVSKGGAAVAMVVLRKLHRAYGVELEVRAALALTRAARLTEEVLPEIESQFGADCTHVTVYTRRAGLVRKLEKSGFNEAAKIMRKRINK